MLIRKNTKAFKAVKEIIESCRNRADRQQLIRLYITKAGHSIADRINVEGIQGDADLFYEINYDAVWNNLSSPDRQLHQSDTVPGIYFFQSASNKAWDETPFEFDKEIKDAFPTLSDLLELRKKEKADKFVFPTVSAEATPVRKKDAKKETKKETKKDKGKERKVAKIIKFIPKGPVQPNYRLKHKIEFTALDRLVFNDPPISRNDVFDYYNKIADDMLPFLKGRPIAIRLSEGADEITTAEALEELTEIPDWIPTDGKKGHRLLLCSEKEHLLWYAEVGAVEFAAGLAKTSAAAQPGYIVLGIESNDAESQNAVKVALATKAILDGLQLPAAIKTDARAGFHIFIYTDSKNKFDISMRAAEYLSKLIRLKSPRLITAQGEEDAQYDMVQLNTSINAANQYVTVPFSLVTGDTPTASAPLSWEKIKQGLDIRSFNLEATIRLARQAQSFDQLAKKKVNAEILAKRLESNYSFLF